LNIANALQNQTVCTYTLGANSIRVSTKGGYFSIDMTAPANCDFTAKSNVNWISVSDINALSGSVAVTFRASVNPTMTRSGTVTIAGQNVTVIQSRVPSL